MLNELLQLNCRCSVPIKYSSQPNYVVCLQIGQKKWFSDATGDYTKSKDDAAFKAYDELASMPEASMRSFLGLPERQSVPEVDEIRDVVKRLKRRITTDYRLERQAGLMKKVIAIYNVIDDLERSMHK